ncbi:RRQRL motif-containing zinc-binding protein [Kitasatospora sp. NPDC059088]|uniref:RRQRL motif-containing zinc-binding protein n=1 Tax=Kitasatospora sp. NPDC059088 TaxID=3346722 RepID=UPI0036751E6A
MSAPRHLDPSGERHGGMPTWAWGTAPDHLATRDQLRKKGLKPRRRQPVVGQLRWHSRKACHDGSIREAYLYRIDQAEPIGPLTPARARGLEAAMRARRTCPTCRTEQEYVISTRLGECTTCADDLLSAA